MREGQNKNEPIKDVKDLIEKGKKQGVLTYHEVMDSLQG
ncbi:MAG: RNA polymerase sigma factor region1.1 domain-containing protein, partial [Desulfotomaculaceae bacterium]